MSIKIDTCRNSHGQRPLYPEVRDEEDDLCIEDFSILHDSFITDKQLQGLAPRTIQDHKQNMKYLKKYVDEFPRSTSNRVPLAYSLFKDYISYMLIDKQLSPVTINTRQRSYKCYLNWLLLNGHINENISIKIRLHKVPEDTIKPLSDSEVKRILSMPDRHTFVGLRDFCILLLILDCGIRINELCNLKTTDLDIKNKFIMVRASNSKNRKFRELPLSSQTVTLMKQLIEIIENPSTDYIFCSNNTGERLNPNAITKNFNKYGKLASLGKRCTPHVIRHTFATNAVKSNVDIFTLQKMLGHSSIMTTRKYVQLDKEDLVKSHDRLSPLDRFIKNS